MILELEAYTGRCETCRERPTRPGGWPDGYCSEVCARFDLALSALCAAYRSDAGQATIAQLRADLRRVSIELDRCHRIGDADAV